MVAASRSAAERAASERGRCMKPPIEPPFPADREKGSRLIGRAGEEKVQWHGKRTGHRYTSRMTPNNLASGALPVTSKRNPGVKLTLWCTKHARAPPSRLDGPHS